MFKVGDRVRRVSQPENYAGNVKIGNVYVVEKIDSGGYLKLEGEVGLGGYDESRFELAVVFDESNPDKPPAHVRTLPSDSEERKRYPLFSGLLAYFPAALAEVSNHSHLGNEKHNPGLPLQHARNKSGDHLDCVLRHIVDSREVEGSARIEELRAASWRILAELQEECERQGRVTAPAATFN